MASRTARKASGVVGAVGATIGGAFIDFLRDTISLISHRVRDDVDAVMDQLEHRLVALQKRMVTQLSGYLLLGAAGLFFVLAAYFFLTLHFAVPKAYVFLGIGVILAIIGLIFKYRAEGV